MRCGSLWLLASVFPYIVLYDVVASIGRPAVNVKLSESMGPDLSKMVFCIFPTVGRKSVKEYLPLRQRSLCSDQVPHNTFYDYLWPRSRVVTKIFCTRPNVVAEANCLTPPFRDCADP